MISSFNIFNLFLSKSPDGFLQFTWQDRLTGTLELDLYLFAGDASFKKVTQSKGRVIVLEFTSSPKKEFFWMQDAKDDKVRNYIYYNIHY